MNKENERRNKFDNIMYEIQNTYKNYRVNSNLFYIYDKNENDCNDKKYKMDIEHAKLYNFDADLSQIYEYEWLLMIANCMLGRVMPKSQLCTMEFIEKIPFECKRNRYIDLIKFKSVYTTDVISNKNNNYEQFYNFMNKRSMEFATNIIHEYAKEFICRINIYIHDRLTSYIDIDVYKFPFTDFPVELFPLLCDSHANIKIIITDTNGNNIPDLDNKILIKYDGIILNHKYRREILLNCDR